MIAAFHVPSGISFAEYEEREIQTEQGTVTLQFPVLTPANIHEIAERVRQGRAQGLARWSTEQIVTLIDEAVHLWLNPSYEKRRLAESLLPVLTGYDAEMIRLELKRFLRNFRRKELHRFLAEELDDPAVLDGFRPRKSGGQSRAFGPELLVQIFSGNVPGLPIWSLVMGLLTKSGTIGKTSSAEPLMAAFFAQSLVEVCPEIGEAIAILPWRGGTVDLEKAAYEQADVIIVYGSDETVEQVRTQAGAGKVVVGYGHKISFAMIGREALTADRYQETIHRLAEDVAIYDQQSCLAPQTLFVEQGGVVGPRQVAQLLGAELERYQKKRPRATVSEEEALAIRRLRSEVELAEMGGEEVALFASETGTDWTVTYREKPTFAGSTLNRTVQVSACHSVEETLPLLRPYQRYLQSVGLAVGPQRLFELANLLGEAGVNRVTAIGQMTRAAAGWHHDGRYNLLDLLRWTDIEARVELDSERYDPDVE
ncbi:acyl-CoA reductase [Tumebacillus sp. ITR2]|uniref:Acyl-CoA reductase n=1 Tax=Tumebacillus amylolyticus TaxID=2801339 RepID=A0ABS1J4G1_9BACL|nr:acyl-CoA reductase [Tumebacillus amylolyticus]MBL0385164.1 acyl-CoA reductase [Tumebacillus amylolyticus]